MPHTVTVSAPGKVLLAGGYLVLERPNVGLVVATDRRFYTTIEAAVRDEGSMKNTIVVQSPQFHATWKYSYNLGMISPCVENPSFNPFIEKTLRVCLLYLLDASEAISTSSVSLDITIRADNDFYSVLPHLTTGDRTLAAVANLPKFLNCPTDDQGHVIVNKTGLGSSAALTTSLVGALVQYYTGNEGPMDIVKIHNLAQICHCHAQGKIGSGFDISSACYGTHVYQPFPKSLLPDLLSQFDHEEQHGLAKNNDAKTALANLAEDVWDDDMVNPLPLPPGRLQVMLADVRGGSESPSMAKTILGWKKQFGASSQKIPHWHDLQELNAQVVELMQDVDRLDQVDYDTLASLPSSEWPENSPLTTLAKCFTEIRHHLKSMGDQAKVPIEPEDQTALCDATARLPGVITCLVPGAGGYDAVACLCIDRPLVLKAIGDLWASWESPVICPLNVKASQTGLRVEKGMNFLE
jgi:phosphomevalonate kinase